MNGIYKKLDNINVYLLSALPLSLAAGPAVIEINTFLIILFFFLAKNQIKFDKIDNLIFVFYFYLILSSLFSSFKIESLTSSFFLIRFILLYLIFKFYLSSKLSFRIYKFTFYVICFTFIILIFDGFAQYFFKFSIFGTEIGNVDRMIMHFRKGEFIMGSYISKVMPIFFGIWYFNFKKFNFKINILLLFLTILTSYCMILSNDRSATFLLLGFLLGLIILCDLKFYYKFLVLFTFVSLISLTLVIFPSVKERYIDSTLMEVYGNNDLEISNNIKKLRDKNHKIKSFNLKINNKDIFLFSTAHEAHVKTAINMFVNNPLIGVGPNNFRNLCSNDDYGIYDERGCSTHPHHILSQVLAETGIFGFLFYLLTLGYLIKQLFKQLFLTNLRFNIICVYSFYFLILMPILPSGNIFNNWYIYSITLPYFYLRFIK